MDWKKISAIICIILVMSLPLAVAQETDDFEEDVVGEIVSVVVKSQDPTILRSEEIEDNDVPVYIYLAAPSLGSLLGVESNVEPLYNNLEVDRAEIKALDATTFDKIFGGQVQYIAPVGGRLTQDNIGFLQFRIKQEEVEANIPDQYDFDFSAEFKFKNAKRLFELAEQDLVLSEEPDEDLWLTSQLDESQFFSRTGFLRVRKIEDDKVYLTVYTGDSHYFMEVANPQPLDDLTLSLSNPESDYYRVQEGDLPQDAFRIKLMDLVDPQELRANLQVTVDGVTYQTSVVEGMPIYPGSTWTINDINIFTSSFEDEREIIKEVKIRDKKRNTRTVRTKFGEGIVLTGGNWENQIGDTERLSSKQVSNIDEVLSDIQGIDSVLGNNWQSKIDTSEISQTSDKTIKYTTQKEDSFIAILNEILPSDYYYEYDASNDKFIIKKHDSTNPCDNIELVDDDELANLPDTVENKRRIYCTAIEEFENVGNYPGVENEEGVLYEDLAYWRMAKTYEELASTYDVGTFEKRNSLLLASQYLTRSLVNNNLGKETDLARQDLANLDLQLKNNVQYDDVFIDDNGQTIKVRLSDVQQTPPEKLPHAELEVEGNQKINFFEGDYLFIDDFTETDQAVQYTYNYEIRDIGDNYIRYKKVYTDETPTGNSEKTQTLAEGHSTSLSGRTVSLDLIEQHKQAYLRITPGTGRSIYAQTNFSVHIPVEKRPLELVPEEIDAKIEKTKNQIEKLENHITKLNKLVKTWKTVCLATFAFLSLKNSFVSGREGAGNKARYQVINGADGNSGWKLYCEQNKASYGGNFDRCMLENADQISKEISESTTAWENVDSSFDSESYKDEQWYQDLTGQYGNYLSTCEEYLGNQEFFNQEDLEMYAYNQYMTSSSSYSNSGSYDLKSEVDNKINNFQTVNKEKAQKCQATVQSFNNYAQIKNPDDQAMIFNELYQQQKVQQGIGSTEFGYLEYADDSINKLQYSYKRKSDGEVVAYTESGEVELTEMTVSEYKTYLESKKTTATDQEKTKIDDELEYLQKKYLDKGLTYEKVTASYGQVYLGNNNELYVATATAFSQGQIRTDYAKDATIEFYPDGTPFCVPTGYNGEFIKVLDYDKTGSASDIQLWNVGLDGKPCTSDDTLLKHQSLLALDPAEEIRLINQVNQVNPAQEGQQVPIGKDTFTASYSASKSYSAPAGASCFDVMEPTDCRTLFNVCDPVLCPPSRFNLNGRWEVDNVVETGIIGSVVLGWGNGDAIPICLTGVLAGLENIKSVLDGYVQCLETAKVDGKLVGVCDKIRSVYVCDLLVKEAAAILEAKGGLLDMISEKVFGSTDNSGGEYLEGVKSGINNLESSINFFTQEYATTAFAAFQGRTTEEIGSMICRQAIYGKMPYFSDFVSELSEPESPSQFTALLTVSEYSDSQREERYQTYYHVFAGNDNAATYQVYLRNSITGQRYYVTEDCERTTGQLDAGQYADETITCITDEGYDEVCVNINGDTTCGFGTVTSAFALDYMTDLIEADEIERNIDSEEECYPSYARSSPSLGSVALPQNYDVLSNGINRVCSLTNPGGSTNPNDWTPVGTCGEDSTGRSLGTCWLDRNSLTLQDAQLSDNADEYLNDLSFKYAQSSVTNLLDEDSTKIQLGNLVSSFNTAGSNKNTLTTLPSQFRIVVTTGSHAQSVTNAQYHIGLSLLLLGNTFLDEEEEGLECLNEIDCEILYGDGFWTCEDNECIGESEEPSSNFSSLTICGNKGCEVRNLGNGVCEDECNIEACRYDCWFNVCDCEEEEVPEEPIPLEEQTEEQIDECSFCKSGIFDDCNEDECHELGDCYFESGFLSNSCSSCDLATQCSDFNDDLFSCVFPTCNQISGLNCIIQGTECVEKSSITVPEEEVPEEPTGDYLITEIRNGDKITCLQGDGDAYTRAMLDAIAWAEGTDKLARANGDYAGYNIMFAGETFSDYSAHPIDTGEMPSSGIFFNYNGNTGYSKAAGRYQFTYSTYNDLKDLDYFPSFGPEEQDNAAIYLMQRRARVTSDVLQTAYETNDYTDAFDPLAKIWASFPYSKTDCNYNNCGDGSSYYGQGGVSSENLQSAFETCLDYHRNQ